MKKHVSFRKSYKLSFFFFLFFSFLFSASSFAQIRSIPFYPIEGMPQQSKTGPTPPPGVKRKDPDAQNARAVEKIISGVPGYLWRHGCGPTAVGMVVGFYDSRGYRDLVPGDTATQIESVNQAIASQNSAQNPRHYEDYSLPLDGDTPSIQPDKSAPPSGDEHLNDCIADFMHTSWSADGNRYGWSWSNMIGTAWYDYVMLKAPDYQPTYENYGPWNLITWEILKSEVDGNHPMVFLVDSDGNGGTDHFVTAIGYRDSQGYQEYACLDTWEPPALVRWEKFRPIKSGDPWGIWGGTSFRLSGPTPTPSPTPTPTPTPPPLPFVLDYLLGKSESVGTDVNKDGNIDVGDLIKLILSD